MIQALINMAVNVNLFPVTGVTLPLVKYGGKFIFVYLSRHRDYSECVKKC